MKFANVLKKIILEQSRFEVLMDKFVSPKTDKEGKKVKAPLTKDEFFELIQADPASRLNDVNLERASKEELSRVKVGEYTPWLIKSYLNVTTERQPGDQGYESEVKQMKERFMEDLYKVKEDLRKFDRFKRRLPLELRNIDILTPESLYDAVKEFSLEKTKASKEEKAAASQTYEHPGGEVVVRGKDWTVVKISDKGPLGKDAACFYGGYYLEPPKGETRWCTSAPGLDWFGRYINKGPLYVVIPNKSPDNRFGEKSGLPAKRYQFHFQSNQFMDEYDRQQDLIALLNGPMAELKGYFKPEFAKGLTSSGVGNSLHIDNFESGAVGKFVGLYGLDELFESLPDDLEDIMIQNNGRQQVSLNIPSSISRFKNLGTLSLKNCVNSIPDAICQLPNLEFIGLLDNPNLKSIPECIVDLPSLTLLNLKGNPNLTIPNVVTEKGKEVGDSLYMFSSPI